MSLAPRLDLRQSQQLVMTPQLQQAIRLLHMTNMELVGAIEAEAEQNPLLEVVDNDGDGGPTADAEPADAAAPDSVDPLTIDELIRTGDAAADAPIEADWLANTEAGADRDFEPKLNGGEAGASGGGGEAPGDIDAFAEQRTTLSEHLCEQAAAQLSGVNLAIARYLIDQIDDAGYYRGDLADAAMTLGVSLKRAESILKLIQRFDPTGAGARSVEECLMLQAAERGLLIHPLRQLIRNLDVLARGDLAALRRLCRVTSDELQGLIRTLRTLNPKPGAGFGTATISPVAPDVFLHRTPKGWVIELNTATMPRVLVNQTYYAELARGAKGPAKQFLSECLASANWLTKALDQRARTIVKVVTEIVRQQEGFFEHGVSRLRPLNLRSVADVVGLHESTVSRVTSNKYLSCERGTFELKYFFTPALSVVGGTDSVSTESVKRRIHDLIAAENPDDILSDDKLVELLRAEGFDVARRTVAKYREGLGLGSSVQRRRRLALAG